jgi:hypothetical protein
MKRILLLTFMGMSFSLFSQETELVSNLNFKIGALGFESMYYAFDEGDVVTIEFKEQKGKGVKLFEFKEYEADVIFSKFKPTDFTEEVEIKKKGFYQVIIENQLGSRICDLKVKRKNVSGSGLSTTVNWVEEQDTIWKTRTERYLDTTIYTPVQVHDKQEFYINSATNIGGQTRTVLPVNLPANTVEWIYTFGCYREQSEINRVVDRMDLLGELTKILASPLVGGIAGITADMISKPSGGNQCDIFVLDHTNMGLFRSKSNFTYLAEGTRENFKSGNVLMKNLNYSGLYLGIRNEDMMHGIHIAIEVVAITKQDVYKMREVKSFTLSKRKAPRYTN